MDKRYTPAFPTSVAVGPSGDVYDSHEIDHGSGGMSLRDYFAAKAMQSYCLADESKSYEDGWPNMPTLAQDAYRMADAMLKAREES